MLTRVWSTQAEEDAAARVEARLGPGVGAEAELRGWLEMGAEKCLAVRPLGLSPFTHIAQSSLLIAHLVSGMNIDMLLACICMRNACCCFTEAAGFVLSMSTA